MASGPEVHGKEPVAMSLSERGHRPCERRCCVRGCPCVLLLGLYLTLRGYHSFDGDQAYRLPLLAPPAGPEPLCG